MPTPIRLTDDLAGLFPTSPTPDAVLRNPMNGVGVTPCVRCLPGNVPKVDFDLADLNDLFREASAPTKVSPLALPRLETAVPRWESEFEAFVFRPPVLDLSSQSLLPNSEIPRFDPQCLPATLAEGWHQNVEVVVNRQFAFRDPATPAVIAAIPRKLGGQNVQVTHLQLRAMVANIIQNLGDIPPDSEALKSPAFPDETWDTTPRPEYDPEGFPDLPDAILALQRTNAVIDELRSNRFIIEGDTYTQDQAVLDRVVRCTGFPTEWQKAFTADAMKMTFRPTPEAHAVASLLRLRNNGPVVGLGEDLSEVLLPDALEHVAYAALDASHELLNDFDEAGLLQPGDVGRFLVQEAMAIRDSLNIPGNVNLDVVGGRVIENLDAVVHVVDRSIRREEADLPVSQLPIRPEEIRDLLMLHRDIAVHVPELCLDPFVKERLACVAAMHDALHRMEHAREVAAGSHHRLFTPAAWLSGKTTVLDLRPIAVSERVCDRFLEYGVSRDIAVTPLVSPNIQAELSHAILRQWAESQMGIDRATERTKVAQAVDAAFCARDH